MYTAHFGLTEPPFALTPDPRYLYLSEHHREALAHLVYGITHGGGFMQLTGEVGTGKTTVCRYLLEQLPPEINTALILNPRLTSRELLATVCDELRVSYPRSTASEKTLVDALSRHLLEAHAQGRRTVLIVDEAQGLTPEVLEQIRLLTNLETTKEKLLQIVLVGQPELTQLLARRELRQLAQRVAASYHLTPCSREQTHGYVRHRLAVAGRLSWLFTPAALEEVHRRSGGIPRLINLVCDRALLGAYANDRPIVDAQTVRRAAKEIRGRAAPRVRRPFRWAAAAAAGLGVLAAAAGVIGTPERLTRLTDLLPSVAPHMVGLVASEWARGLIPTYEAGRGRYPDRAVSPGAASAIDSSDAGPTPPPIDVAQLLGDPGLPTDRREAFVSLFARWGLEYSSRRHPGVCDFARSAGLWCLSGTGAWVRVRQLNLPAIIELIPPGSEPRYATVVALHDGRATVALGGREVTVPFGDLAPFWNGSFIALWKAPPLRSALITPGYRGPDVMWLRQKLDALADTPPAGGPRDVFDAELVDRVKAFQRTRSLAPDGVAGEETLAHLSAAVPDEAVPVLSTAR